MSKTAVFALAVLTLLIGSIWGSTWGGISASAWAGTSKEFRDWSVYCSDGLVCTMVTYPQDDKVYSFGFKRGTAANAGLDLVISLNGKLDLNSELKLSILGQSTTLNLPVSAGKFEEYDWLFSLENRLDRLLPALKAGSKIKLIAVTDNGVIKSEISLSGVVASMLFIDEAQGRVGKRDALHAQGDEPAADVVTRVRELKSQTQLPAPVRKAWAGNFNQCSDDETDIIAQFGGIRIDLDKDGSLFLLPCNYPGAYNMPYIAVTYDNRENNARTVSFPVMGNRGPTNMDTAYNISWDDKKSQLAAFFKGRGIGDCGSKQLWQWGGGGIYGEFELLEERLKDDCDEKPDEFPLIWPPD